MFYSDSARWWVATSFMIDKQCDGWHSTLIFDGLQANQIVGRKHSLSKRIRKKIVLSSSVAATVLSKLKRFRWWRLHSPLLLLELCSALRDGPTQRGNGIFHIKSNSSAAALPVSILRSKREHKVVQTICWWCLLLQMKIWWRHHLVNLRWPCKLSVERGNWNCKPPYKRSNPKTQGVSEELSLSWSRVVPVFFRRWRSSISTILKCNCNKVMHNDFHRLWRTMMMMLVYSVTS